MNKSILLAALVMLSFSALAQKPSETKLYQKAINAGTVKEYDKFLSKYPSSCYAPEIIGKKDTLLHVSPYSTGRAGEIAEGFINERSGYLAFGWRDEGKDKIIVFRLLADKIKLDEIKITDLEKKGNEWRIGESVTYPYADEDNLYKRRNFLSDAQKIKIHGEEYFNFTIKYTAENGLSMLIPTLYCPRTQSMKEIKVSCLAPKDGKTECRIDSNGNGPEEKWLVEKVKSDPNCQLLSDEDFKTLEAYRVWEEKNPMAMQNATKISAVILPEDCSLVSEYKGQLRKESSGLYKAAMFDFRDYTVIVAYEDKSGKYILEWLEPMCTDSRTHRLLNSISFTNSTTLEMFYYQGNRTFKYLLNLSSKTLKR